MLPDNSVIGRYEIRRRVAHGGMGTLYLAQDPILGRPVAVKLFLGDLDLPDARERFVREARAAAALNHPHIVTIYDYGEYSAQPYMVMEFIQGETLAELIRRRAALPIGTKLRWMEELCSAVEYAHAHGVIHRDLKPLNLMVDSYGRLKVLDFGIARMRGSLVSHATARIGTAGYMAPEQIRGGNIDHRSDLFSIGVVCYELITYVEPFAADVDVAITNRILEEEPKPLRELDPDIDPLLADLVWKALRKDPASRFQDAESMRKALAAVRRQLEAAASDATVGSRPGLASGETTRVVPRPKPPGQEGSATGTAGASTDKRAERDALVKERTAQIQTSLLQARQWLEARQWPAARKECERVLGLDNAQPEALDLLRRIDLEIARADAVVFLQRGHEELQHGAITKAVELLDRARGLTPDNPEVGRLDRALRIARAQHDVQRRRADRFRQELRAAEEALDRGVPEEALGHAREALEIDPASEQALAVEAEALRRIDEDTSPSDEAATAATTHTARPASPSDPTILAPAPGRRSGPVPAPAGGPASTPAQPVTTPIGLAERWRQTPSRRRTMILAGTAAVIVVAAAVIVTTSLPRRPAPPPPPAPVAVLVVIDATPWAMVKQVQREGGEQVPLTNPAFTPLALPLLPGKYLVTLEGPQGPSQSRVVEYLVDAGQLVSADPTPFEPMTADKYLEIYLKEKPPGAAPAVVR